MKDYSIVTNPLDFISELLSQTSASFVDEQYSPVIRVLIYYIWRGAFRSRAAIVQNSVQSDLGFLALSAYKALQPIVQLIRMGYPSDTMVLQRAHMERIALLGYLNVNRHEIGKYSTGKGNLQKRALIWAKEESLENWMNLYSMFSNVAHSKIVGPAGHILDENPIGEAFRQDISPTPEEGANFTEILLGGVAYALAALDPIVSNILSPEEYVPFPADPGLLNYLNIEDVREIKAFLEGMIETYSSTSSSG